MLIGLERRLTGTTYAVQADNASSPNTAETEI